MAKSREARRALSGLQQITDCVAPCWSKVFIGVLTSSHRDGGRVFPEALAGRGQCVCRSVYNSTRSRAGCDCKGNHPKLINKNK